MARVAEKPDWHDTLNNFVDSRLFQTVVTIAICLNALALGVETLPSMKPFRAVFVVADLSFVLLFTVELVLRISAKGRRFFRSPWNVFDFIIITGGLMSASNLFAALRAFRVLRLLRVVTAIPRMRIVVRALMDSIPGISSVAVVALLVVYVFAVIASQLYGQTNPQYFGDIFTSMYTLFQVITLEGWRDIADAVQAQHRFAWAFFVLFVLVGTFTMLNLFIAIVVRVVEEESDETEELVKHETEELLEAIRAVETRLSAIEQSISQKDD
ncbi:MAG: ion transporter [Parvularcula sp.]